jgi:hypothetical protein
MITEEHIRKSVSNAEELFQNCWTKLSDMNNAETLFSFQPTLLTALYQIESAYRTICKEERELISKKSSSDQKQFAEQMKTLARYKSVLTQVLDIGKALGDSFAWIFYGNEKELLKKHYDHEFIPHLALGIGGRGEYEFARNTPRFGKYIVLAHSITTFLRLGDVSLIDPIDLKVVAIGELKTQKKSDTEISVNVTFVGAKIPKEMLPKISEPQDEPANKPSEQFPLELLIRLKKQVKGIQEAFKPPLQNPPPNKIEMRLVETKLKELFDHSSLGKWGSIKADRGLLLVGMRFEEMPLYLQLKKAPLETGESFQQNMEKLKGATAEIFDKSLPQNFILTSWILYPANGRYFHPFGMMPLFFWPLDAAVRKAIIFQKMRVMTLYNPGFLIDELNQNGFDVQFGKDRKMRIVKKIGDKRFELAGMDHFIGAVRTQFYADTDIVSFVRAAVEKIEAEKFKQPTHISLDLDFLHDSIRTGGAN